MMPATSLRYARQVRLPEVGVDGQERLQEGSALVVGAGGLGAPALHHLVASGVGRVGVIEFDTVDLTNLHRQTLYSTDDVGRPKLEAARDRLHAINPDVVVEAHEGRLSAANADLLIGSYDLVLDGSDTFSTRYAVNDASVRTSTPNVFASVSQFSGQASIFGTENGPCYRCLFPEPPPPDLIPNCEDGGVLGVVPSLLGTIQAAEAIKWMLGVGSSLVGR
ncbi:MAG: HesA/MoeB/ThiF family protein, partial [Bacteroidota bacterium]